TVASASVARDGAATVNYDGMESLTVDAGTLGDTVNVNSTFATTPVTVNGNGGPDVFTVGGGDWDSNVVVSVTVTGGAGTNDSLRIDDTLDSIVPADDYTVSDVQTTKTSVASAVNYATIESYTLDAN